MELSGSRGTCHPGRNFGEPCHWTLFEGVLMTQAQATTLFMERLPANEKEGAFWRGPGKPPARLRMAVRKAPRAAPAHQTRSESVASLHVPPQPSLLPWLGQCPAPVQATASETESHNMCGRQAPLNPRDTRVVGTITPGTRLSVDMWW